MFSCKEEVKIKLTPVEQAWLKQHVGNLDVLFGYKAPPNAFYNETNEYVGLLPDYTEVISELIGVEFNFKSFETWDELIYYSSVNSSYIIVGIANTEERSKYLSFTEPFIEVPYVIVVREKSDINNMDDLSGKTVCTVRNYAINDYIADNYPEIKPLPVLDNLEGLRKVSTGIYDAMILNQMYASHIIEQQGITNLKIADESGYMNYLSAAVSIKDPIFSSIISKAVNSIDEEKRKSLYRRWVNITGQRESEVKNTMSFVVAFLSLVVILIILLWSNKLKKQLKERINEVKRSQSRYKHYLENAPVGVFLINRKGKFLELNRAFEEMTGLPKSELFETKLQNILPIKEKTKIVDKLFKLSLKDHIFFTISYDHKFGNTSYWTLNATARYKEEILCFIVDTTENVEREKVIENNSLELIKQYRKSEEQRLSNQKILSKLNETTKNLKNEIQDRMNIESALIKSEEKFRKLVENLGEGICLIDTKGIFRFVNPMMMDIFGEEKDLVNKSIFDFIQEKDHTSFAFNTIFNKTDKIKRFNMTIITAVGEKKILSVVSSYHSSGDFTDNTNLYIFSDITKLIEEQDAMIHSSKMDAIGQLAGGIAHDFNNMLTGIIGSAQVLNQLLREENSDCLTFVDLITQTAERAADLTSKLLAFSRKGSIEWSVVNINDVLNDTKVILSRSLNKRTEISLTLNAESVTVLGDYTQLQNVFMNLGINSSHAMPEGGMIRFSTENIYLDTEFCNNSMFDINPGEFLKISVADTGVGIDEKNINKVFEPFFTTKDKNKGTGLGLAAVYGTVQEHQGAISISSKVNVGTEITIFIPSSVENETKEVNIGEEVHGEGGILVVDDEEVILTTLRIMLEDLGYDVFDSKSASEAINIFKLMKSRIDLVILDLVMPEMSGAEVFMELKKIDPNTRILITSGNIETEDSELLIKKEADAYLTKPYKKDQLSKVIADVLNRK